MEKDLSISVIITAAGIGKRLNADINKTLLKIDNKTILELNLNFWINKKEIREIIVTYNNNDYNQYKTIISKLINKNNKIIKLVEGGKERSNSVYNAIKKLKDTYNYVMIHDCARVYMLSEVYNNIIEKIKQKNEAIIPFITNPDTMYYFENDTFCSIDRNFVKSIQTPQCFSKRLANKILNIIEDTDNLYTDESSALLSTGEEISFIKGSKYLNKITDKIDYQFAKDIYLSYIKTEKAYIQNEEK